MTLTPLSAIDRRVELSPTGPMPARDALAKQSQRFLDHLDGRTRSVRPHGGGVPPRSPSATRPSCATRGITDARRVDERAVTAHSWRRCRPRRTATGSPYRATSVVRALSSVRAFHRFLLREGKISSDPTAAVIRPKLPRSLPKPLSVDDVARVLAHPDRSAKGLRDRAVLETLYGAGLRISELVGSRRGRCRPGGGERPRARQGREGAGRADRAGTRATRSTAYLTRVAAADSRPPARVRRCS